MRRTFNRLTALQVARLKEPGMYPDGKAGRGPIRLCLSHGGLPGEVEMDLHQEFPVTPEIKGAVKSLDGVLAVEDF